MSKLLADKLKAARQKLKLSQPKAAQEWDIPVHTLRSWEIQRRTPSGLTLRLLLEKLDAILATPAKAAPKPKAK